MHQEQDRIACSIFQQKELSIKEFTDRLNEVEDYQHKIE